MRYFSSDSFSSSEFLELLRLPTKRQNPKEELSSKMCKGVQDHWISYKTSSNEFIPSLMSFAFFDGESSMTGSAFLLPFTAGDRKCGNCHRPGFWPRFFSAYGLCILVCLFIFLFFHLLFL